MQFRQLSHAAALGSMLPGVGRLAGLISSAIFMVLGVQHFIHPTDFEFSKFLYFNFLSTLPMAVVLTVLLYCVSLYRRIRASTMKNIFLMSRSSVAGVLTVMIMMSLTIGVSFYVYFYLGYQMLGPNYLLLSIIYLLPVFWMSVKQIERYILTILALFLAATLLTWVALLMNNFILHFPLSTQLEHMDRLPDLGTPDMIYIQMSLLFIIINGFAVYEILWSMTKKWRRKMRRQKKLA